MNQILFKNQAEWRLWLEANHDKEPELWMIYYKKHTGKQSIVYQEVLDEALCFGWIDSTAKRIDDETYQQKFTPRSDTKNWSLVNKLKVKKLIAEGRMTEAGLKKIFDLDSIHNTTEEELQQQMIKPELVVPQYITDALQIETSIWERFLNLTSSQKRTFVDWIENAKRPETKQKRIAQLIDKLRNNTKVSFI